jgi:hypothetical protein
MYITDNRRFCSHKIAKTGRANSLRAPSAVDPSFPVDKVPINDPKHWRERAEEARTVADELTDPDSKRRMLRIADDYDELARRAEKRLRDRPQ